MTILRPQRNFIPCSWRKIRFKENTLISYGDIIFKRYVLHELLNDQNNITLVVDADCDENGRTRILSRPLKNMIVRTTWELRYSKKWDQTLTRKEIFGEFIGLWKVNKTGADSSSESVGKTEQVSRL